MMILMRMLYENVMYLVLENGRQVEGHSEGQDHRNVEEGPARREAHVRRLALRKVAVQGQVPLHGSRLI